MFSKEDILKQLRGGADPQEIADAMAEAINGAINDFEEEKKKNSRAAERKADARKIVDEFDQFCNKWTDLKHSMGEEEKDLLADMLIDLFNEAKKEDKFLNSYFKPFSSSSGQAPAEHEIDDETLQRFLASLK